jgi:hypothetical protein
VRIDLHHLLLENRLRAGERRLTGRRQRFLLSIWAWLMVSTVWLGWSRFWGRWLGRVFPWLVPASHRAVLRALPKKSFRRLHAATKRGNP